jgi:hypothetical protein
MGVPDDHPFVVTLALPDRIRQNGPIKDRTFEIEFLDSVVQAFKLQF